MAGSKRDLELSNDACLDCFWSGAFRLEILLSDGSFRVRNHQDKCVLAVVQSGWFERMLDEGVVTAVQALCAAVRQQCMQQVAAEGGCKQALPLEGLRFWIFKPAAQHVDSLVDRANTDIPCALILHVKPLLLSVQSRLGTSFAQQGSPFAM